MGKSKQETQELNVLNGVSGVLKPVRESLDEPIVIKYMVSEFERKKWCMLWNPRSCHRDSVFSKYTGAVLHSVFFKG